MIVKDEKTLDIFRNKQVCEMCGRYARKLEPHHLVCRGMAGGSRLDIPENLVALCGAFDGDCHNRAHRGDIKKSALWLIVSRREGKSVDELHEFIYRLLRAEKGSVIS